MASENQASQSKPRSMLPRTLVVILSPISEVPTMKQRRLSGTKYERVFEDFRQCNKQSINVQLQDAVDDIQFVGWISPFTLLIHGSTEDMDTIELAWIGRMLKPPSGFVIRDFGEISEVKMKQISQSQFISISDTLCEIVKGLNESQIAATFESVVARLCSSFDTVVIPPMSAIKKCLDQLVKSLRLDFINGSYHFKRTIPVKPREKLTIGLQAPLETQTAVFSTSARSSREKDRNRKHNLKEHSPEDGKRTAIKKLKSMASSDTQRQIEPKCKMKEELGFTKKHSRKGKHNKVVKSSSLKVRKPNHCIPRRQYSYQELHSHTENPKELECKKQIKKRNSFLGRLSRFFQIDDEKLTSNGEIDNDLDVEGCHNGWERIVTDEQVELIPSKAQKQKKPAVSKSREKKNKRKKPKRIKGKHVAGTKAIDKKSHSEKLSVRNKNAQYNKSRTLKLNKLHALQSSESSTNASLHSRSPDWTNKNFTDRDKRSVDHQLKGKFCRRRDKSPEQYSLSSYSDSSCSNLSNLYSSLSSESSAELARKSFHYSEEETTDVESLQGCEKDCSTDFCSTQAICGDLELSRLSLNKTKQKTTLSSSDTSSMKHVEKHSAVIPGLNKTRTLNHDSQQNILRGRNPLQLIGVL